MAGPNGPVWVPLRKAATFAEVKKVYKRANLGQGTSLVGQAGPNSSPNNYGATLLSAPRGFLETVRIFVQGLDPNGGNGGVLPAWIKKRPGGGPQQWQDVLIDVTSIPGVRPLRDNGKWYNYTG